MLYLPTSCLCLLSRPFSCLLVLLCSSPAKFSLHTCPASTSIALPSFQCSVSLRCFFTPPESDFPSTPVSPALFLVFFQAHSLVQAHLMVFLFLAFGSTSLLSAWHYYRFPRKLVDQISSPEFTHLFLITSTRSVPRCIRSMFLSFPVSYCPISSDPDLMFWPSQSPVTNSLIRFITAFFTLRFHCMRVRCLQAPEWFCSIVWQPPPAAFWVSTAGQLELRDRACDNYIIMRDRNYRYIRNAECSQPKDLKKCLYFSLIIFINTDCFILKIYQMICCCFGLISGGI